MLLKLQGQNDLKKTKTINLRKTKNKQQKYFLVCYICLLVVFHIKPVKYNSYSNSFFRHVKYAQLKICYSSHFIIFREILSVECLKTLSQYYHSNELAVAFTLRAVTPLMVL